MHIYIYVDCSNIAHIYIAYIYIAYMDRHPPVVGWGVGWEVLRGISSILSVHKEQSGHSDPLGMIIGRVTIYVCTYIYIYVYMYVCIYVCIYVYMSVCNGMEWNAVQCSAMQLLALSFSLLFLYYYDYLLLSLYNIVSYESYVCLLFLSFCTLVGTILPLCWARAFWAAVLV